MTHLHPTRSPLLTVSFLIAGCSTQPAPDEALTLHPATTPGDPGSCELPGTTTFCSFHDNGQPALLFHTDSNGDLHGPYRSWFSHGQLHIERCYDHGRPDGLITEWDAEGNIVHEQRWFHGVPVN